MYNPEIHHRHSVRLKEYDYSSEGLYFITVCAQDKKCMFGKITDGVMRLNEAGRMVEECWKNIPQHYPNIQLLEFIIMPNHIHGIIHIVGAENIPPKCVQENISSNNNNTSCSGIRAENIPPLRCTLGSIIKGFKIGVTKQIGHPVFQRNYYEHIIRNQHSYEEISDYIVTNPLRWEKDQLYSL